MGWLHRIFVIALLGCTGSGGVSDHDLGELVISKKSQIPSIEVDKVATQPSELFRSLQSPHFVFAQKIGAYTFQATSHMKMVKESAEELSIKTDVRVDYSAAQSFRAVIENDAGYGYEYIGTPDWLFVRPRHGRFHKRKWNDKDEAEEILSRLISEPVGFAEFLLPYAKLTAGKRVEITRGEKRTELGASYEKGDWRKDANVDGVTGWAQVDEHGYVKGMELSGQGSYLLKGSKVTVELSCKHSFEKGAGAFSIPTEWVTTHEVSSEVDDHNALLKGLAPPLGAQRE